MTSGKGFLGIGCLDGTHSATTFMEEIMYRVLRESFNFANAITMPLPRGAQVIHFAHHRGNFSIWYVADPDAPPVPRRFHLIATGQWIADEQRLHLQYIATTLLGESWDNEVWHLFEEV